jgi:hypothetical protein
LTYLRFWFHIFRFHFLSFEKKSIFFVSFLLLLLVFLICFSLEFYNFYFHGLFQYIFPLVFVFSIFFPFYTCWKFWLYIYIILFMVFIFYNIFIKNSLLFILSFYSKWLFNKFGGLSFFVNLVSCPLICNFDCLFGFGVFKFLPFFLLFVIFEILLKKKKSYGVYFLFSFDFFNI